MKLRNSFVLMLSAWFALALPGHAQGDVHQPTTHTAPWVASRSTRVVPLREGVSLGVSRKLAGISRQATEPTVIVPRGTAEAALHRPALLARVTEPLAKPRITLDLARDGTGELVYSDSGVVRSVDVTVRGTADDDGAQNLAAVAYERWSSAPYSLELDAATRSVKIMYADGTEKRLLDADIPALAPPVHTRRHGMPTTRDVAAR